MKTQSKHTFLVWAVVILAVMNISTLATILFHKHYSTDAVRNTAPDSQQLETDAEKFSGRYFRDKLNFDSEQMEEFRSFNPEFRQQAKVITIELAQLRKQMHVEMSANNSDTAKLNALSDSIGRLHSSLKKLTYKYYIDMKNICNTDQQKQLEQLFGALFTNDQSMSFPQHGGRPQHGKRMNN